MLAEFHFHTSKLCPITGDPQRHQINSLKSLHSSDSGDVKCLCSDLSSSHTYLKFFLDLKGNMQQ